MRWQVEAAIHLCGSQCLLDIDNGLNPPLRAQPWKGWFRRSVEQEPSNIVLGNEANLGIGENCQGEVGAKMCIGKLRDNSLPLRNFAGPVKDDLLKCECGFQQEDEYGSAFSELPFVFHNKQS